jgi:metal-sulfur cluster biosynthetic enzyme
MRKEITQKDIRDAIATIIDPELGIDILTLGLIYETTIIDEHTVHILMTFTSPMCPAGGLLTSQVHDRVAELGFDVVDVEVTFDPPWQPTKELREALGV